MGNQLTMLQNKPFMSPSLGTVTALFAVSGWYLALRANQRLCAIEDREVRRQKDALRAEKFNKGYPNTWYYLAKASDIRPGEKKTFRIAGREILAYRTPQGELGVLHPFCPHLGTNLKDGRICQSGNIMCPAHGWIFNTDGKCVSVPDSKKPAAEYPNGAHATKYHHATFYGMIYVWIHDDWAEPTFTLDSMFDYVKNMKPITSLRKEWVANMHIMEPTQNSADIHHFKHLHYELPFFKGHITTRMMAAKCDYNYKGDDFVFRMDNVAQNFRFFGKYIPEWIAETFLAHKNSVICYGPTLQLTLTSTYFGQIIHVTNWVPTEQFMLESYYMTFVDNMLSTPIGYFLERLLVAILAQDKPVWEARDNSMRLMDNDGYFVEFRNWLNRFYTENNKVPCVDLMDW